MVIVGLYIACGNFTLNGHTHFLMAYVMLTYFLQDYFTMKWKQNNDEHCRRLSSNKLVDIETTAFVLLPELLDL